MSLEHGTPNMPKMVDGKTDLDEKYFNLIHGRVDQRLAALEELRVSWESATDTLTRQGLARIDEVLAPAFQKIEDVLELGFMTASSSTSHTLALNDELVFIVDEGARRELFQPTAFLAITRLATIADYALARLLSYNSTTGALTVEIISVAGNPGPHTDWEIGGLAAATVAQQALLGTVQTLAGQVTSDKATVAADRATTVTAKNTAVSAAEDAEASKISAAASAAAAATWDPSGYYTISAANSAISAAVSGEASARATAVSNEATARGNADTVLSGQITTQAATARKQAIALAVAL
ncbi:hypothetical protein J2Y63_003764 [Shinella sp. BE166]|uniref:hypothetical protein n=1 Tax=Shinella sp. BE166 TaxID=3373918 RepID=UPI003EB73C9F